MRGRWIKTPDSKEGTEGPGGGVGEAGMWAPCAQSPHCRRFTHKPKRT